MLELFTTLMSLLALLSRSLASGPVTDVYRTNVFVQKKPLTVRRRIERPSQAVLSLEYIYPATGLSHRAYIFGAGLLHIALLCSNKGCLRAWVVTARPWSRKKAAIGRKGEQMKRARSITPTEGPGIRKTTKSEPLLERRCDTSLVALALLLEVSSTPAHICMQIEQEEEESAIDAKRRKRLGDPHSVLWSSTSLFKADIVSYAEITCMIVKLGFVSVSSTADCTACREGSTPPGHHCGTCTAEAAGLLPGSDVTVGKVPSHHEHDTPQPAGIGLVNDLLMAEASLLCILPQSWHLHFRSELNHTIHMYAQSQVDEQYAKTIR